MDMICNGYERDAERNQVVTKVENVGMASDGPTMVGTLL
jgi:hypothetical protein